MNRSIECRGEQKAAATRSLFVYYTVQRLITREGAREGVVILHYFWQMTIAWSDTINKDDTFIFNFFIKLYVSANTSVQFKERKFEQRNFGLKCFWCRNIQWPNLIYPKHPHTSFHSVDLFISTILQNYCDMLKNLFEPSLRKRGCTVWLCAAATASCTVVYVVWIGLGSIYWNEIVVYEYFIELNWGIRKWELIRIAHFGKHFYLYDVNL